MKNVIDMRPISLLTKLASLKKSELIDSDEEVDYNREVVVGVLPDDLKRLYTLWQMVERQAEECEDKLGEDCNNREHCQACEITKKAGLLREIFLYSVQDQYPKELWGPPECPSIGIRKGFLVIRPAKKKEVPVAILVVVAKVEPFSKN